MSILKDFMEGYRNGLDKQVSVDECVSMVEKVLKQLGVEPSDAKEEDFCWWIVRESSAMYVKIGKSDMIDASTLEVTSPILSLPSTSILPFYRRCLELNSILVGCGICLCEDRVLITIERSLRGLDYQEVEDMILSVAMAADAVIEEISEEFSAKVLSSET